MQVRWNEVFAVGREDYFVFAVPVRFYAYFSSCSHLQSPFW